MKERLEKFKKIIPYGRQDVSKEDIKSVIKVLKSDFITQGSVTPEFEREVKTIAALIMLLLTIALRAHSMQHAFL